MESIYHFYFEKYRIQITLNLTKAHVDVIKLQSDRSQTRFSLGGFRGTLVWTFWTSPLTPLSIKSNFSPLCGKKWVFWQICGFCASGIISMKNPGEKQSCSRSRRCLIPSMRKVFLLWSKSDEGQCTCNWDSVIT